MSLFDGSLFDPGVFQSGGADAAQLRRGAAGTSRGMKRRKLRYHWEEKFKEVEKMIRRRK